MVSTNAVEAAGWGKTKEAIQLEGVSWNKIYLDLEDLYLSAFIPNYSGADLNNNSVLMNGHVDKKFVYMIITTYKPEIKSLKSKKALIQLVQDANPNSTVKAISATKLGAKYGVDEISVDETGTTYWRYLVTENRLIAMVTTDSNEERRALFFESVLIE